MSDWDNLDNLVAEWEKSPTGPRDIQKALTNLSKISLKMLVTGVEKEKESEEEYGPHAMLFGQLLDLARRAVESESIHPQVDDLINSCKELIEQGVYLPEAINFLNIVLDQYSTSIPKAKGSCTAFEALLLGISKKNDELANACMQVLSFMIARFNKSQRNKIIKKIARLSYDARRPSLLPSLKRYTKFLDRAEDAVENREWTVDKHSKVISVHSHKGGVGKTTVAITLALELASAGDKVCIIDCDDEGPSLLHSVPFEWEINKDIMFFVDWYDSERKEIPNEMIPTLSFSEGEISCIPGSYLASDVARLDQSQRGRRPFFGDYRRGQYRVASLIKYLITDKDFKHVIIDTGPGIAHLTMDVLLAILQVDGSNVFVMRPRVVDISQFCIDMDWFWWLKKLRGKKDSAIVINFAHSVSNTGHINLMDGEEIVTRMQEFKIFNIFSNLYFKYVDSGPLLKDLIKSVWKEYQGRIYKIPETAELRSADCLDNQNKECLMEIIGNLPSVREVAKALLNHLSGPK